MVKNILNFIVFGTAFLLFGTALPATAEEFANDLWIVEPTAGDNLKNVMQETVDGVNNQAIAVKQTVAAEKASVEQTTEELLNQVEKISQTASEQPISLVSESGLENAAVVEEIKSDAIIQQNLPELKPGDVLKEWDEPRSAAIVRRVFKPVNKNIEIIEVEKEKPAAEKGEPEVLQVELKDGELEGPKQILRDKIHRQLYMVQSVNNKPHQIEELKEEKLPAVQLIKVPEEAQGEKVFYDEFDMTVDPQTPRSFNYPIGDERRKRDEEIRADFNPFWRLEKLKEEDNSYHQEAVAEYKKRILECTRERSEQTSLETDMLEYDGKIYDNAAYLSNTLTETETCLRELGYEIVEVMYLNDPDVVNDYIDHVETLHVDSTSVDFNPKFCGENCSLKAVVDAQRTRMAEFQKYLCHLLNESPKEVFENMDVLQPGDLEDIPFMGDEPQPRVKPQTVEKVRLRKEPQVVRRHVLPASLEEKKAAQQPKRKAQAKRPTRVIQPNEQHPAPEEVPFFEGMEVPMIDESEL